MQYRRAYTQGACYFFTVVTEKRQPLFADDANVNLLRNAFYSIMQKRPFTIDAAVILPDHLHCIWTLPVDDADFSTRWRLVKTWFSKRCDERYKLTPNTHRMNKKQQAIWQHRYWEHQLRDEQDVKQHIDYIHYNPVKHGYVTNPVDWKHSSIHRFIKQGVIDPHWGEGMIDIPNEVGYE
jgi:putative transposase